MKKCCCFLRTEERGQRKEQNGSFSCLFNRFLHILPFHGQTFTAVCQGSARVVDLYECESPQVSIPERTIKREREREIIPSCRQLHLFVSGTIPSFFVLPLFCLTLIPFKTKFESQLALLVHFSYSSNLLYLPVFKSWYKMEISMTS